MFDTRVFSRGIKRRKRKEKVYVPARFRTEIPREEWKLRDKSISNHFVTKIPKYVITQKRIKFPLKKLP